MLKMNSKPSVDIVMLKMNSKPSVDIVMLKINSKPSWHTNQFFKFWALARNIVNKMYLAGTEGKTTRVVAVCEDSR
jgi:hypothetical protein